MSKSARYGFIVGLFLLTAVTAGAVAAERAGGRALEMPPSVSALPVKPINLTRYNYLTRYLIENAYEKLRLNDEYQARVFLEKALEFNSSDPFLLGFIAYLYERASYWGVAEQFQSALVAAEPDNAKAYLRRAYSRYRIRSIRGGILDAESALAIGMDPSSTMFAQRLLEELTRIEAANRKNLGDKWGVIQRRARTIEESGDLDALERYYTELAEEPDYRTYALTSRGYLRLSRNDQPGARRDFEEAIASGNLDDVSRLEIQSLLATLESETDGARDWARITEDIARLEEAGDSAALDAYLVALGGDERYRAFSLSSRGFLHLREGRIGEARELFNSILALPDSDSTSIADAREALFRIQRENLGASEWAVIRMQTDRLARSGDGQALDAFLTALYNRPRYALYALASRIGARFDRNDIPGVLADLTELAIARHKTGIDWGVVLEARNRAAALQRQTPGWPEVERVIAILERDNLQDALESYLEDLSHRPEYSLYACVSLAWMQLDAGNIRGGRTYLAAARSHGTADAELAALLDAIDQVIRRETDRIARLEDFGRRVDALLERADTAALRRLLDDSAAGNGDVAQLAVILRGFLNLHDGEYDQARADFDAARADSGLDYRIRDIIDTSLLRSDARLRAEEAWRLVQTRIDELKQAGDQKAEEEYYTALAEQREYRVFALYSRAHLRLAQGREQEALADFSRVLEMPGTEPAMRQDILAVMSRRDGQAFEQRLADIRAEASVVEARDGLDGLEKFYTGLMQEDDFRSFALAARAQVRTRQNNLDAAQADIDALRALADATPSRRAELEAAVRSGEEALAIRRRVEELEALEDWAALESLYTDLTARSDQRLTAHAARGYLRLGQGRTDEALEDFAAALDDPAIEPALHRDLVRVVGEIAAGRAVAGKWQAVEKRTREFEDAEDWEGLENYYTELMDDADMRAHALASRAQVRTRLGRYDEARGDYARLRRMGGQDPTVRAALETTAKRGEEAIAYHIKMAELQEREDWNALEALYDEMAERDDLRLLALTSRGYLRLGQGRNGEALADFAAALSDDAIDDRNRLEIARAVGDVAAGGSEADAWLAVRARVFDLEKANDPAGLEDYYTSLAGDERFRVFALQNRGMLRFKLGRRSEAEADFAEAMRLTRSNPERAREVESLLAQARDNLDLRDRIALLEAEGDVVTLESLYTALINEDDENRTLGYVGRAYLLLSLERTDEAMGDFAQALRREDLDTDAKVGIVNTLAQLAMDRKLAEEWLAVRNKARELEDRGAFDELETFFTELIDQPDFRAYGLASRGWLRLSRGHEDEAEADFNAVLALADEDPEMQEEVRLTLERLEEERTIRVTVAELEKDEDWEGIDRVYTSVIARGGVMRTYGYMMRGYYRYTRLRRYEALSDFVEALRQPDMDPASRAHIVRILANIAAERRISEEWLAVRSKAMTMEWEGQLDELEDYYTELAETEQFHYYGLAARGYLRMKRGMIDEGRADIDKARARAESLEEGSLTATALLDRMEEEYQIDLVVAKMEKRKDWAAIDAYYGKIAEERSDLRAFALARRGYFRYGREQDLPAIADFANALKLEEVDPATRLTLVNTVSDIAENRRDDSSWLAVQKRIRELLAAGDLEALEEYYTNLTINKTFRQFALQERGLLRLRMGKTAEGNADIAEALAMADNYELAYGEIEAEKEKIEAMKRIRARVADLEAAGDWDTLNQYYTDLSKQSEYRVFALSARGFLRLSLGRHEAAMGDFARVLSDADVDPATQRNLLATMVTMADRQENAGEWSAIFARIAELETAHDWTALEEYYGELAGQDAYTDFAHLNRAALRLRIHRLKDAEDDLDAVLDSATSTQQMRDDARAWLTRIAAERNVRETAAEFAAMGDVNKLEEYLTSLASHDKYRAFALTSRAYLRLEHERAEEAEEDFAAVLAEEPESSILRRDLVAMNERITEAREWAAIQAKIKELETAERWFELETYYTELAEIDRYRALAYSGRGYLLYRLERVAEAESEFARVLAMDNLDPNIRRDVLAFMAEREGERKMAAEWEEARLMAERLVDEDDYEELEALYTRLIESQPNNAYAHSGRAMARVALGKYDLAIEDLEIALARDDFEADSRKYAEEMLENITTSLAAGGYPDNPRATTLMYKAGESIRKNDSVGASALLERVAALRLSSNQSGILAYYQAELLWLHCDYDRAFQLYQQASCLITDDLHLGDAYWRMADYYRLRGNKDAAIQYARLSHATSAENPWRPVQLGSLFYEYKMYDEAICYFEMALASCALPPDEISFYGALAEAHLMRNNQEMYAYYMERHIDSVDARILGSAGSADDIWDLQNSRRAYAKATKRFRGDFYVFSNFMKRGRYVAENLNTLYYRLTKPHQPNIEAYIQTIGTLGGSYSGPYYSEFTGTTVDAGDDANFFNTFRVAVGLRYNSPLGFGLSVDRLFGLGRYTDDDVRVKLDYYKGIGNEIHPLDCSWNYASFYGEATYSIEHNDFTALADARVGRGFRAENISDRLAVIPFVGVTSTYGGKDIRSSERLTLDAGPGVVLRHWNQGSRYKDPMAMYEVVLQYRFGLSHNRDNVFSVTLGHRF